MVLSYVRPAALGAVVSGILAGPAAAKAQSAAALSAAGFPIVGGQAVELSGFGGGATGPAVADAATVLSTAGHWIVAGVVAVGKRATLVLRDADHRIQASFAVPARAAGAVHLRAGDTVLATATEAGAVLHKDGRVVAFVAADARRHLVSSDAL